MGSSEKQSKKTREITYQVGMQKGKIHYDEQGRMTSHQSAHSILDHNLVKTMEHFVWKRAPIFPRKSIYFLLWILPAVSCTATLWLVYRLLIAL